MELFRSYVSSKMMPSWKTCWLHLSATLCD